MADLKVKKKYWWLLLVIIIAAFLRFWNITTTPPGLYPDEAMNGNNALEALKTHNWKVFYPENNGREGLFINIQSIFVFLFGHEPWVLRLPSAIFGILTVLGIYFLTRELFRTKISPSPKILALLTAFLLATSFWHINFSRIGFRAIMAPFFLTWSVYFLLLLLRKLKEQQYRRLWLLALVGGALYGLGMYSYIAYRATPILILFILIAYWLKNKDIGIRKQFLLFTFYFLLSAIVIFLPLGVYFLNHPADFFGRTAQISVFSSPTPLKDLTLNTLKTLGMFNFVGDYNWRHNIAGQPELFWPVGIMFLIGVLASLRKLNWETGILFIWLIVAALPVVISDEGIPHALRSILMIPAVFILSGIGGITIYEFFKKRVKNYQVLRLGISLLLALLISEAYYTYFIRWAKNPNTAGAFAADYAEIGHRLNSLPNDQPKYVIVNATGVDVRGLPIPTQTVMFITDTFREEGRQRKNIHYLLPDQAEKTNIPKSAFVVRLK